MYLRARQAGQGGPTTNSVRRTASQQLLSVCVRPLGQHGVLVDGRVGGPTDNKVSPWQQKKTGVAARPLHSPWQRHGLHLA